MKVLIRKKNSYRMPGSPNAGPWGQYLYFDDGSSEFDPGHRQNDAIAEATQKATGTKNATFSPGTIAKTADGRWVPVEK